MAKKTIGKEETKIVENKFLIWGMLGALLLLVFVLSTCKIQDDDFFWHLSTGKFITENKVVPEKDVFGYTTSNAEWIPFEWGWDVLSYNIYLIGGGYKALYILSSLLFTYLFFLYFTLLQKFKVNSFISVLLLFLLVIAMMDRLSPRPHIFTYLFFVVLLNIILSIKYIDREKYLTKLYWLPVIFLLWGNLHLGVVAGGLLLFVFVICETIIFYSRRAGKNSSNEYGALSKEQLTKLIIYSAISALVLLINPHGIQTYLYAYSHTKMKMLEAIQEWQNPFTGNLESSIVLTMYRVLLIGGLIALIYAVKKRDLFFGLTFIVFAAYSIRAIRFTVDYEIVMLFFIAVSINYFIFSKPKPSSSLQKVLQSNGAKGAVIVLLLFVCSQAITNNFYSFLKYNKETGWGIRDYYTPVKLYDFIKENKISGVPFNNFETGGYMMWTLPGEKIFIDSRNLNDGVFYDYVSIYNLQPGFENKFTAFGIDYVIYFDPLFVKNPNAVKKNIVARVYGKHDWKLIYWDDHSMLFVKDIPKFSDVIAKYEYKFFDPITFLFYQKEFNEKIRTLPDEARTEITRKSQTDPSGYFYSGMKDAANKIAPK